ALRDGDTQFVAQSIRDGTGNRSIPPADEHRGDRRDTRIQACLHTPLNPAQESAGGRSIVLPSKKQGYIDRHTGNNRFFDCNESLNSARDLNKNVGPVSTSKQLFRGA